MNEIDILLDEIRDTFERSYIPPEYIATITLTNTENGDQYTIHGTQEAVEEVH